MKSAALSIYSRNRSLPQGCTLPLSHVPVRLLHLPRLQAFPMSQLSTHSARHLCPRYLFFCRSTCGGDGQMQIKSLVSPMKCDSTPVQTCHSNERNGGGWAKSVESGRSSLSGITLFIKVSLSVCLQPYLHMYFPITNRITRFKM
jgi:hypothetical protein